MILSSPPVQTGASDLKKLSSFAKKWACTIGLGKRTQYPNIVGDLFTGVPEARKFPPMRNDRRISYTLL